MKIRVIILLMCGLSSAVYCQMADCYTNRLISICPSTIVVKKGQTTSFLVRCSALTIHETFAGSEIQKRVQGPNSDILCTLKVVAGGVKAMYQNTVGDDFKNRTEIYSNATTLSLHFKNASYVDFTSVFVCSVSYLTSETYGSREDTASPRAIPDPDETILTISPVNDCYNSTDNVSLVCTAYVGFSSLTPVKSKILFQKLIQGQWHRIPKTELTSEPAAGTELTDGQYIRRTDTITLTLASTEEGIQQFRCVVSFGTIIFDNNAGQLGIIVTAANSSDSASWDIKLTIIISVVVFIVCLLFVLVLSFIIRRNQRKKSQENKKQQQKTSFVRSLPQTAGMDDSAEPEGEKMSLSQTVGMEDSSEPEGGKKSETETPISSSSSSAVATHSSVDYGNA